jgi:hypothetical protein
MARVVGLNADEQYKGSSKVGSTQYLRAPRVPDSLDGRYVGQEQAIYLRIDPTGDVGLARRACLDANAKNVRVPVRVLDEPGCSLAQQVAAARGVFLYSRTL